MSTYIETLLNQCERPRTLIFVDTVQHISGGKQFFSKQPIESLNIYRFSAKTEEAFIR